MPRKNAARKNTTRRAASGKGTARAEAGLSRLELLKRAHFTPEGKAERVARALAALHEDERIKLSPEKWKWVAENSSIEDWY